MNASSLPWFKTPQAMLVDPRFHLLSAAQFGLYMKLLFFKCDNFLNRLFGDTQTKDECVQKRLMLTATQAQKLKRKLQAVHLIDEDWQPLDWDKWHSPTALRGGDKEVADASRPMTVAERVRKHRAEKKADVTEAVTDVTDVTDVTLHALQGVTRVTRCNETPLHAALQGPENTIENQEVTACNALLKNKDLDLRKKKKKKQKQQQKPATGTDAREAQPEPAEPVPAVESKSDFVFFEEAKALMTETPTAQAADPSLAAPQATADFVFSESEQATATADVSRSQAEPALPAEPASELGKAVALTAAASPSPALPSTTEPKDAKPMIPEMNLHDTTAKHPSTNAMSGVDNEMIHETHSNAIEVQNNANSGDLAKKHQSSRLPPVKKRTLAAYLQECKSRGVHPVTTHPQVRAWMKAAASDGRLMDGRLYTLAWLCFKQRYLQAKDKKTGALITHANWPLKFLKIMETDSHGLWERAPHTGKYHLTTEAQQAIIAFADKNATIRRLLNYYHDERIAAEKRAKDHVVDDVPDDFDPSEFMAELRRREGNETVDNLLRMVRANPQVLAQMH